MVKGKEKGEFFFFFPLFRSSKCVVYRFLLAASVSFSIPIADLQKTLRVVLLTCNVFPFSFPSFFVIYPHAPILANLELDFDRQWRTNERQSSAPSNDSSTNFIFFLSVRKKFFIFSPTDECLFPIYKLLSCYIQVFISFLFISIYFLLVSTPAVVGICLGGALLLISVAAVSCFCYRGHQQQSSARGQQKKLRPAHHVGTEYRKPTAVRSPNQHVNTAAIHYPKKSPSPTSCVRPVVPGSCPIGTTQSPLSGRSLSGKFILYIFDS